tara:strand:- start:317 stop:445 length:129 start_codon:yes stop_codon:yes gene_type:complete
MKEVFMAEREAQQSELPHLDDSYHYEIYKLKIEINEHCKEAK